jgi:hypothetical protein
MKYKIVIEFEADNVSATEIKNLIETTVDCCPLLMEGATVEMTETTG